MNHFISVNDVADVRELVQDALGQKKHPFSQSGKNKTLGLVFFNPSLRTRMSTQKAAMNLGMNMMVMNIGEEGWKLELKDGSVMDSGSQEHIKDAVRVMSLYCDVLGIRSFANLKNREEDYREPILSAFRKYSGVPVMSLESATLHPLQSLADIITIREAGIRKPKIAVTWANHPKPLSQAVVNSFLQWVRHIDADVRLAFPEGYALKNEFMEGITVTHEQEQALENADFVYTKNWSSYEQYGLIPRVKTSWTITREKMDLTSGGRFMHCLPVRRNVIASDEVIDNSWVYRQAENRVWAAQVVLKKLLEKTE